ncbi:MAG TPA: NAD(P)/FAD-dependent oxidoreductase [Peptococcaceae bacterium]|jgi:predicted Rossmann fold flavoprotein|nr:NAD(P)/FAD-dependent oxidoreductase [Clostridia bacterium]HPZ71669.1 NAD(P)/FAD-dependent oxidoreductase [Peptococcaceae bacterium]HQD53655.1 NAD(P)/FAD-dependent oxidoreductase [Peptococcaceae bacterium]
MPSHLPVIVVGGGAAGLIAAGRAAELGAKVIILEKNKAVGRKLLISGKGRCNITNNGDINTFMENYPGGGRFLYSAFHHFFQPELLQLLKRYGVETKVERGGRIFPASDKASDVVQALLNYARTNGAELRTQTEVLEIWQADGAVKGVKTAEEHIEGYAVIIATGGKSYPATGSTGDGYKWAAALGHTVITPRPALVPLNIQEEWVKELQGLSLKNVAVTLTHGEKVLAKEFGEMLFTHFGVSGPVILTLSRLVVEKENRRELKLHLNLKPALDEEKLDKRLQRDFQKYQRRQLQNALDDLLPKRLIPIVIRLSGIEPAKFVHQITREERHKLVQILLDLGMTVLGPRSLAEAIVTAGGVSLREVNPRTMESKLVSGLYFAGEILDIDGFTGGYNLQAAFSSGYLAGESAAQR